jgi:branched-subunit amino acid ABC-type transport system permease component
VPAVPPPDYRSAVGFVAILLVLTLRPRGILGPGGLTEIRWKIT